MSEKYNRTSRNDILLSLIPIYIALTLFGYQLTTTILWKIAEQNSRIVTTPFRAFMLLFSVVLIMLSIKWKIQKEQNVSYICFCGIIILYSIKVLFDLLNAPEKADFYYETAWNYEIYIVIPSFIAITRIIDKINFEETSKFIIIVVLTSLLFGIYSANIVFNQRGVERIDLGENHILNAISLGHLGCSGILICFAEWPSNLYLKKRYLLLILKTVSVIISLYLIIYAASKGPIMALFLTLFIYVISLKKYSVLQSVFLFIAILCAIFFYQPLLGYINNVSPILNDRFTDLIYNGDEGRAFLFNDAIKEFLKYPFGGGYFMIPYTGYSHNIFVDFLMTWGIEGSILFVIISLRAIYNSTNWFKQSRKKNCIIPLLFLQYLVAANMSGNLYLNIPLILLYMIVLFYDSKKTEMDVIHAPDYDRENIEMDTIQTPNPPIV